MKTFAAVIEFNRQIIKLEPVEYLNSERLQWFKNTINEELNEFIEANEKYKTDLEASKRINVTKDQLLEDKVDMIDAIMDLIYFALGRLYEIGCTEDDFIVMWNAIHHANMTKVRGNKGRGSNADAIKPAGWQGPEKVFIAYKKGLKNQLDDCEQTIKHVKNDCAVPSSDYTNNDKNLHNEIQQLHLPGLKYDDDKPNLSLVFGGFANALLDIGAVGTFGAKKYFPNSWQELPEAKERYMASLLRHIFSILRGENYDSETGRSAYTHAAWNALALCELFFKDMSRSSIEIYNAHCDKFAQNYLERQKK